LASVVSGIHAVGIALAWQKFIVLTKGLNDVLFVLFEAAVDCVCWLHTADTLMACHVMVKCSCDMFFDMTV